MIALSNKRISLFHMFVTFHVLNFLSITAKNVCLQKKKRFYCNSSHQCISQDFVCDGHSHCHSGEDEVAPACNLAVCHQKSRFYCNTTHRCISTILVCDENKDCSAGEDEVPSACTMDVCQRKGRFFCNISGECISKRKVCNGYSSCISGEDEAPPACNHARCLKRGKVYCNKSPRCITLSQLCNGKANCPNGEDENTSACALRKQCKKRRSLRDGCLGQCKPGHFGKYCEKKCSDECLNGICNKSSGICKNCTRRYLDSCSLDCGQTCIKRDGFPQCDRQSGKCLHGCSLNHGHYCNETCRNCKRNSYLVMCDVNGVCLFGCENDYWDQKCNIPCSATCQGDEDESRCNASTGECLNGCTRGWSGRFCRDIETYETGPNLWFIWISVIFIVGIVVGGIICYLWTRKRLNRQQNERVEPRRIFPVGVPPGRQPSRSRRQQSSHTYAEVNEETMEHYHYICEQNPPDHYDKVNDRPPCICRQCVRERVDPILARLSSGSSDTTIVEPYATGGGSIRSTRTIHSYISHSELNPLRSITQSDHGIGIVHTKEFKDDRYFRHSIIESAGKNDLASTETKSRPSLTRSDGDLNYSRKTDKTNEVNPRRSVVKSNSCIELVCTHEYLDLEALYQTAKAEDRRKLAAKYFDYGEEIFGNLGQFEVDDIHAIEREEFELRNSEIGDQNLEQHIESSL